MSIAASVNHIAPVARALTEGNRMVTLKSAFAPVSEVAHSFQNPVRPNFHGFTTRVALESEEELSRANEVIIGADQAAIEDQVEDLTRQVNAMVFTARNVIVPTVDNLVNAYLAKHTAIQPNVSVNVFKYHDVHNSSALVNHLVGKYTQIQAFNEYRTFLLPGLSAEQIVTLVSENNPHLDQSQAVEWLLEMGADRVSAVWKSLFGTHRGFDPRTVSYLRSSNLPLQIDELLLAYCLTGSLMENPQDVIGESVDLAEWEKHLAILHELLGHKLVRAYEYRAQDAKQGRLILASEGKDGIRTGIVSVVVNGDIYSSWLANNGDIQALLGAAVFQPQLSKAVDLDAVAADLSARWMKYYPVLRQTCADNAIRDRRNTVAKVFLDTSIPTVAGLPEVDERQVRQALDAELRALSDDAYNCPFRLFADLVCRVYYREQPLYVQFLHALDRYSKVHPQATGRELAIESTIEMVATWLANQITTVTFKPLIDTSLVQSNEDGSNVKISADNEDVARNVGEVEEPEPVNEVLDAELEQDLESDSGMDDSESEQETEVDSETDDAEQETEAGADDDESEQETEADESEVSEAETETPEASVTDVDEPASAEDDETPPTA